MHGLENEHQQSTNIALNDGDELGDGEEGARGGRPLAKVLGDRARHLLQPVDVRLWCGGYKYNSGTADEASSKQQARPKYGQTGRSIDRCSSHRTQRTRQASRAGRRLGER